MLLQTRPAEHETPCNQVLFASAFLLAVRHNSTYSSLLPNSFGTIGADTIKGSIFLLPQSASFSESTLPQFICSAGFRKSGTSAEPLRHGHLNSAAGPNFPPYCPAQPRRPPPFAPGGSAQLDIFLTPAELFRHDRRRYDKRVDFSVASVCELQRIDPSAIHLFGRFQEIRHFCRTASARSSQFGRRAELSNITIPHPGALLQPLTKV